MPNDNTTKSDRSRRRALKKLLGTAKIPTLPMVAQKLVDLCRDDRANFKDFARVIETDQGLASRLLRVANSAYYGLRHKATTLDRAITALGLKYVKSIALGFHLATALNQFAATGFNMSVFWRENILRAVMGKQLAARYVPDKQDEAFLIGLLQNCGVPFLAQVLGAEYGMIWRECRGSHTSLLKLEQELFEFDHVKAAEMIVEHWALPELLAKPIRTHHRRGQTQPSDNEQVQLCQIGYFVGTLSLNNPDSLSEEDLKLPDYCRSVFGLNNKSFREILQQSHKEFQGVSQLFSNVLNEQVDVASLLTQANDLLSGLTDDGQQQAFDLQAEVTRLRSLCTILSNSLDESVAEAEIDSLTGLLGRGRLERSIETTVGMVHSGQSTLTALFIDVDDFKDINNSHGHVVGDEVLCTLARLLKKLFGGKGSVARYGGDEMVVILLGLKLKQAVTLTARLVEQIRQIKLPVQPESAGGSANISCSIGMLFCEAGSSPGSAARVLELADNQMYKVKKSGKNSFKFQALEAQTSQTLPAKQD